MTPKIATQILFWGRAHNPRFHFDDMVRIAREAGYTMFLHNGDVYAVPPVGKGDEPYVIFSSSDLFEK